MQTDLEVQVEHNTPSYETCEPHPKVMSVVVWRKRIGKEGQRFLEMLRTQNKLKAAILARARLRVPTARITRILVTDGRKIPETSWVNRLNQKLTALAPEVNLTIELFRNLTEFRLDDKVLTDYLRIRHEKELSECRYYLLSIDPIESIAWFNSQIGIQLEPLFQRARIDPDLGKDIQQHILLTYASFPNRLIEPALPAGVHVQKGPSQQTGVEGAPAASPSSPGVPTSPDRSPAPLPKFEYSKKIDCKLPQKTWGAVIFSAVVEVKLKGSVSLANPQTRIEIQHGEEMAVFEAAVTTSFGSDITLGGEVKPGEISKLSIGLKNERFEAKFEANTNLLQPFTFVVKKPAYKAIEKRTFGDWVFEGKIEISLKLSVSANYAWPGWARIIRTARDLVKYSLRTGRVTLTVVGGLFIGGEIGTYTTFGILTIAIGAAVAGATWILFGLYKIGEAHRNARAIICGDDFAEGYLSMYSNLIHGVTFNEADPDSMKEFFDLLYLDWKREFKRGLDLFVEEKDRRGLSMAFTSGKAAMLQAMMEYYEIFGNEAWQALRAFHSERFNRDTYLSSIYRQVKEERKDFGISPFLIRR